MFWEIFGSIFTAALVLSVLAYAFPMCFMHPLASGKISGTDIVAVRNRINNVFFIPAGDEWLVIDAGSDAKSIGQEMRRMAIDGHRVRGVFLTHTDYDHVASLVLFPNAAIYLSKQEKQMTDGSVYRQFLRKNRLPELKASNRVIYLADNEETELCGQKVRMLLTPGHTRGSAMYAVNGKYLFTGDAFKVQGKHLSVHPYTMDRKQAKETINGIRKELKEYEKVFTAHYGLIENPKRG